jgi:hypothetical protein
VWPVLIAGLLVVSCNSTGNGSPLPASAGANQDQTSSQTCALATKDGNTFVLVRGAAADNDCRLLLADLASSTIQTWQASTAQLPPSGASTLFCDLTAQSGNRVDVWGDSLQTVGRSICSQIQIGVIPAELAPPRPTPLPTVCSFDFAYRDPQYDRPLDTVIIVRGPDAVAECGSLSPKLPTSGEYAASHFSLNWQFVMNDAPTIYRICQGTIGSSSIEVSDSVMSPRDLPTWTTAICAQITAGTLGAAPAPVGGGTAFAFDPSSSDSLNAQEHTFLYTLIKPCPRAGCENASLDPRFAWMTDWEAPVPAEFLPCLTDISSDACARANAGP